MIDFLEYKRKRSEAGKEAIAIMKLDPRYKINRIKAAKKAAKTRKEKPLMILSDNGTVVPLKPIESPLVIACNILGSRLVEKPAGYFLDGNPVNLTAIMKAANQTLLKRGLEQITVNPAWVIKNS